MLDQERNVNKNVLLKRQSWKTNVFASEKEGGEEGEEDDDDDDSTLKMSFKQIDIIETAKA